jgi:hypothetical protein
MRYADSAIDTHNRYALMPARFADLEHKKSSPKAAFFELLNVA